MGLFDWLGPTSLTKRRGWDHLPAAVAERKSSWTIDDYRAVIVSPLVSGPGLSDRPASDGNSAVYACLRAIASAYLEAPLVVYTRTSPTEREPLWDSPLQAFLEDANPSMSMRKMLGWVQWMKHVDGNAYLRKIRAGNELTGNVVQLWPISPSRIKPMTVKDSGDFISYYRYYQRPGVHEDIPVENIIHFRLDMDDGDHRLGCSPLKRLVREISSDEQATRYADRLLANLAISGLSMEFDKEAGAIDQPTADILKARIQSAYGGDNIGGVSVLSPGAKLVQHGFSPEQMDLRVIHDVPETRITAVMRVPAIVAGLSVGLQHTIYNNFSQAREQFAEDTILPLYADDDEELTRSLARDFSSDRRVIIAHDISQMRSLQEDENARATRLQTYVAAGILDANEARAEIGRDPRSVPAGSAPTGAAPGEPPTPATRSRAPLILVRKSVDDIIGGLGGIVDAAGPNWEAELLAFLAAQKRRVDERLRSGGDSAEGLVAEGEAQLLGDALLPLQSVLLSDVSRLVVAELGIEFGLDDAATRAYLQSAGSNIGGITDTTREAVRRALTEGQLLGEGIDQLARRLRDLPAFNDARARVVARTELGHSQIEAALANYRASGVVTAVRVHDGDFDEQCAAMNGRVFPLNQPPPALQHPNCTRALAPVLDAQEATA